VRRLYGISESDTVLLFVGDLEPTLKLKGIDYLLDALKSIVKLFPSLKLLVVGGGSRLPELRAIVNSLGLDRCVTFCGQVSGEAMPKYYAACDLFVFPSYGDSLGLVVLEAMAVGKPVIVSNIPGINEIVKSGETGLLIPPKDPSSLAHAITYLLKNNDLMTKMGKNARTSAIQRSWDMVALEMSKIYENVVRGRSC
jgi:phosphatidylinositol alpha-mannosyltransferase